MSASAMYIIRIRQVYPDLSGKFKVIADYILNNPGKVVRDKVKDISADCECDDAMIIRFCQKIGYKGFSDLKASIASDFMPVSMPEPESLDPFERIRNEFLDNNSKMLHDTVTLLDKSSIISAVGLLKEAGRIYLLGAGASGIVAQDLQMKLLRLGYNAVHHADPGFDKMLTGLAGKNDVVLAVSFSGENRVMIEAAVQAKKRGIPVICLTNFPASSLAQNSDIVLLTSSDEKLFRLSAMTSRLAQCLVLDFLVIQLAMDDLERSEENILRTQMMIED